MSIDDWERHIMGCLIDGTLTRLTTLRKGETYKFMNSKHVHLWQGVIYSKYLMGCRVSLIVY